MQLTTMVNLEYHAQHETYYKENVGIFQSPSVYVLASLLLAVLGVKYFV